MTSARGRMSQANSALKIPSVVLKRSVAVLFYVFRRVGNVVGRYWRELKYCEVRMVADRPADGGPMAACVFSNDKRR